MNFENHQMIKYYTLSCDCDSVCRDNISFILYYRKKNIKNIFFLNKNRSKMFGHIRQVLIIIQKNILYLSEGCVKIIAKCIY